MFLFEPKGSLFYYKCNVVVFPHLLLISCTIGSEILEGYTNEVYQIQRYNGKVVFGFFSRVPQLCRDAAEGIGNIPAESPLSLPWVLLIIMIFLEEPSSLHAATYIGTGFQENSP